ncbi:hypothetical protein C1A38_18045 [Verrucosispora sp. ts21]|nr:hypothetical protein C1A38_18045 [Verrucosispora sp. ts21]
MSISIVGIDVSADSAERRQVPAGEGITRRFAGHGYTMRLQAAQTAGASVPPGGGPVPHTHTDQDE